MANRRLIADVLEGLSDEQLRAETLCRGWTVHHMAAHLVQPMLVGFGRFFLTALRYRGDTDRTVDHLARRLARKSRSELVSLLPVGLPRCATCQGRVSRCCRSGWPPEPRDS